MIRTPDNRDCLTTQYGLLHQLAQAALSLLREANQNRIPLLYKPGQLLNQIRNCTLLRPGLSCHVPENIINQRNHIQQSV